LRSDEGNYRERLDQAVVAARALANVDPQRFWRALRGTFPAEVGYLLRQSGDNVARHAGASSDASDVSCFFPEPHPLDYDWRFEPSTAERIAEIASAHGRVLCLGTPAVFQAIAARKGHAHLIDRNSLIESFLAKAQNCTFEITDLADAPRTRQQFDAAVLDPPWYLPCYELWLSRALAALARPSVIFVTIFRDLTRPGADREREQLLTALSALGRTKHVGDVAYSTPRFEAEVLERIGLPTMPSWRMADLVRVETTAASEGLTLAPAKPTKKLFQWQRYIIGGQVVAVRTPAHDNGPITYVYPRKPASGTDLMSVSRRYPSRVGLTVWTSRNRAVAATGTGRIAAFFASISGSRNLPGSTQLITCEDRVALGHLTADLRLDVGA